MRRLIQTHLRVKPQDVPSVVAAVHSFGGRVVTQTVVLTVETPRNLSGRCFVQRVTPFYEASGKKFGRIKKR